MGQHGGDDFSNIHMQRVHLIDLNDCRGAGETGTAKQGAASQILSITN
jgi:hypothetical protein